jgi:hypothetical protein
MQASGSHFPNSHLFFSCEAETVKAIVKFKVELDIINDFLVYICSSLKVVEVGYVQATVLSSVIEAKLYQKLLVCTP